jgi:hypothetical protein
MNVLIMGYLINKYTPGKYRETYLQAIFDRPTSS